MIAPTAVSGSGDCPNRSPRRFRPKDVSLGLTAQAVLSSALRASHITKLVPEFDRPNLRRILLGNAIGLTRALEL